MHRRARLSAPVSTCSLDHLRCGCAAGRTTAAASERRCIDLALDLLVRVHVGFETNGVRPNGG